MQRWTVAAAVVLVASGCGTRISQDEAVAPAAIPSTTGVVTIPASPGAEAPSTGVESAGTAGAAVPAPQMKAVPRRNWSMTAGPVGGGSAQSARESGVQPLGPPSGSQADSAARGSSEPAVGTASGLPVRPSPATKAPVVVASVGTLSGPAGATIGTVTQGAQLWVKYVNERAGGLNGHRVEFVIFDDGGDPARHRAQVQEAVERLKAVAFLANAEPITGQPSVEYITDRRIPVVGGTGGEAWFYDTSPMFFPQMSFGDSMYGGWVASTAAQLVPQGVKRLGTVICVEAGSCDMIANVFDKQAPGRGFAHVYRARASIAQPDYTAECLAARSAGADVLFLVLDSNAVSRFAAACARQGFRPRYATGASIVADRFTQDRNLEGLVASSTVVPYFLKGLPAIDEFQLARRRYGSNLANGVGISQGWVAGKLLQRAAALLPETPTSDAVLRGLWSLRDEALGGLTHPLSFLQDMAARPKTCWSDIAIRDGAWEAPNGPRINCL